MDKANTNGKEKFHCVLRGSKFSQIKSVGKATMVKTSNKVNIPKGKLAPNKDGFSLHSVSSMVPALINPFTNSPH